MNKLRLIEFGPKNRFGCSGRFQRMIGSFSHFRHGRRFDLEAGMSYIVCRRTFTKVIRLAVRTPRGVIDIY